MHQTCVIIPCYNEASRLPAASLIESSKAYPDLHFLFVNDGSTDGTLQQLEKLAPLLTSSHIISYTKNAGKGEAIRKGMLYGIEHNFHSIGYLDADLSASLDEFYKLKNHLITNNLSFVCGARIKKLNTFIKRSFVRHAIGRLIASIIDIQFKLGIYDTQCGAKVFKSIILQDLVKDPFHTRWFFDVELLLRLKTNGGLNQGAEVPLQTWTNKRGSKLGIGSTFAVLKDLYVLLLLPV